MIKTLFLGSNYEALITLKALNKNALFEIIGVITQPNKPFGRKMEIKETEINIYCKKNNLNVFHTEDNMGKYIEIMDNLKPELIVCKSFGEIIPKNVLDFPKYGAINVHFSLLPRYRGAIPIQKAILSGDEKTGISIMEMTEGLDEGDVLEQIEEDILFDDTNESLRKRLMEKAPVLLIETLEKWVRGDLILKKQKDMGEVSYCWKKDINKENAKIDWKNHSAEYVHRMVRAFIPWPIAWCTINEKKAKVFEVLIEKNEKLNPGEFKTEKGRLLIGCKNYCIEITKLQIEGKNLMNVKEFLNGTKVVSIQ